MKTNLNNIIFSFIFGTFFILFILWNRFIRIRLPKELTPVEHFDTRTILVCILTIMFFSITLYYILRLLKIIPRENSFIMRIGEKLLTYKLISNSYQFIETHIMNGPKNMYEYIHTYIYHGLLAHRIHMSVIYFGDFIVNRLDKKEFIFYLCALVIPRFIPAIVFVIEVLYFHQLVYFYKLLILLIIPLITKILLYLEEHYVKYNLDSLYYYFNITMTEDTIRVTETHLTLPDDIAYRRTLSDDFVVGHFESYQYVYEGLHNINKQHEKYKYYVNIVIYGLYFIGFLYYTYILVGAMLIMYIKSII